MTRGASKSYWEGGLLWKLTKNISETGGIHDKEKSSCVLIRFDRKLKYPVGFPKGMIVKFEKDTVTRKIKSVKLLDWMYDNKRSPYNTRMLIEYTRNYRTLDNKVEQQMGYTQA